MGTAALILAIIPALRRAQRAGGPTTASKLTQKLSLQTEGSVEIPVPVFNTPVKILIGNLPTSIPTHCLGFLLYFITASRNLNRAEQAKRHRILHVGLALPQDRGLARLL